MRFLLLSDIHANLTALEAVLADAEKRRWDELIFLGDLVGYYAEPDGAAATLEALRPAATLLGNHDSVVLDILAGTFRSAGEDDIALSVLRRHARELEPDTVSFLADFTPLAQGHSWQATHGGLRHPWEYIDSLATAQGNFPLLDKPILFVGHTHVPKVYATVNAGREPLWRTVAFPQPHAVYRIPPRARLIINPGSVGQPRDGCPLASYAIYDEDEGLVEFHRVVYDITAVQRRLRQNGYPDVLGRRLEAGR